MINNKFLSITSLFGEQLISAASLSGTMVIISSQLVYLYFSDDSGAAAGRIGLVAAPPAGASLGFDADPQRTRDE